MDLLQFKTAQVIFTAKNHMLPENINISLKISMI